MSTVHAWGFFDVDGRRRGIDSIAASHDLTPHQMHEQVVANIQHFGGEIVALRTTRTLDGWLVGTEFESPARANGRAGRMWHVIKTAADPWPIPRAALADPETETDRSEETL